MFNPSILSKCFLFKVAKDKLFEIAVAAINRSARSISFLFLFKPLFRSTATLATVWSNARMFVFSRKSFQKSTCAEVVPVYISNSVIAEIQ
jgi:hypothetical protein